MLYNKPRDVSFRGAPSPKQLERQQKRGSRPSGVRLSARSVPFFAALVFGLVIAFVLPLLGTLRPREVYYLLAVAIVSMLLSMAYNVHLKGVYGSLFSMRAFRDESLKGIINTQYTTSIMLVSGAFLVAVLHARTFFRRMLFLALLAACVYFNMTVGQRGIIFFLSFIKGSN